MTLYVREVIKPGIFPCFIVLLWKIFHHNINSEVYKEVARLVAVAVLSVLIFMNKKATFSYDFEGLVKDNEALLFSAQLHCMETWKNIYIYILIWTNFKRGVKNGEASLISLNFLLLLQSNNCWIKKNLSLSCRHKELHPRNMHVQLGS